MKELIDTNSDQTIESAVKSPSKTHKTNVTNKKLSWKYILPAVIILILLISGILLLVTTWQKHIDNSYTTSGEKVENACTDILNSTCWTESFKPTLEQQNNQTNVLVLGIDTRDAAVQGAADTANTDSILVASYNYTTKKVTLTSIPRDTAVNFNIEGKSFYTKINQIYAYGAIYSKAKNGIPFITNKVSDILGIKIQYTVIVHFDALKQIVDQIGGIDVNIPGARAYYKGQYVDVYPYVELPAALQKTCKHAVTSPGYGWCIYSFSPGINHMDGETALIYTRMREWTDDFSREARQHDVIDAIKQKLLGKNTNILQTATYGLSVYNAVTQNLTFYDDITGKTFTPDLSIMLAGLAATQGADLIPANIVLDPNFAGGGVVIKQPGASNSNYIYADPSFGQLHKLLTMINSNFDIYRDNPIIYESNQSGAPIVNDPLSKYKSAGYWFVKVFSDTKPKNIQNAGIQIIDYTNGADINTINLLKQELTPLGNVTVITANSTNNLKPTTNKENIAVYFYPAPVIISVPAQPVAK